MPSNKSLVNPGEIYAIPLFVSDQSPLVNFSKQDFSDEEKKFSFIRIIQDQVGAGIIFEGLNLVSTIKPNIDDLLNSKRLLNPLVMSGLGIKKKRWRKIYTQENYDREVHSRYSQITFALGTKQDPTLWKGGEQFEAAPEEAENVEPWIIWDEDAIEKMIISALTEQGIDY